MKLITRFFHNRKLSYHYIGPYMISKMIENVAYEFELPPKLVAVHSVFHICMSMKSMDDPSYIIHTEGIVLRKSYFMWKYPLIIGNVMFKS